ncbi:hypothetical protein PENTCL1PPCAC_28931, partial [Pristionchus entomophagus]
MMKYSSRSLTKKNLGKKVADDVASVSNGSYLLVGHRIPVGLLPTTHYLHVILFLLNEYAHSLRERARIGRSLEFRRNMHSWGMSGSRIIGVEALLEGVVAGHLTLTLVQLLEIVRLPLVSLLEIVLFRLELTDALMEFLDLSLEIGRKESGRVHSLRNGSHEDPLSLLLLVLGHAHLLLRLHDVA